MKKSSSLEEEKIIKNVRNLFRLTKKINDTTIKEIRDLFRLKKQTNFFITYNDGKSKGKWLKI